MALDSFGFEAIKMAKKSSYHFEFGTNQHMYLHIKYFFN